MDTETKTALTASELALYLGCAIETPEGKANLFGINTNGGIIAEFGIMGPDYHIIFAEDEVKPILRPLSDMTEVDFCELLWGNIHSSFTPTEFQYLLSQGFDIFNWIEQGKAINKTLNN